MNRISACFSQLSRKKQKAFIPFIMGGDPDYETSLSIIKKLPSAGADIIEVGIPFSDPMADGPTIQAAGQRSLKSGTTLDKILKMVREFRKTDKFTPIILMGYFNPILQKGVKIFSCEAIESGVDGVLLVDLPIEEENEVYKDFKSTGLSLIKLVAPTTSKERMKKIASHASGFIYYVSITGITGTKSANFSNIKSSVKQLKNLAKIPVAVGFGISSTSQVKEAAGIADAVVVGSALVKIIAKNGKRKNVADTATGYVKMLSSGLKR